MEQKPPGAKIDVYLVVSFSITVTTMTSSLSGTSLMFSFSNNTIRETSTGLVETYQPAKQSKGDLAAFTSYWGRREKSKGSQLGKDNNSEPARIILRGLFPL